jgi:hypothetical protein
VAVAVAVAAGPAAGAAAAATHTVSVQYECTVPTLGTSVGAMDISGSTPARVTPGSAVTFSGFALHASLPASLVDDLWNEGVRTLWGTLGTFDLQATDSTPATVNAAGTGITIPRLHLTQGQSLNLSVPARPIAVHGFKAKHKGSMQFSPGPVATTIDTNLVSGLAVTCTPTVEVLLATTTVG